MENKNLQREIFNSTNGNSKTHFVRNFILAFFLTLTTLIGVFFLLLSTIFADACAF